VISRDIASGCFALKRDINFDLFVGGLLVDKYHNCHATVLSC